MTDYPVAFTESNGVVIQSRRAASAVWFSRPAVRQLSQLQFSSDQPFPLQEYLRARTLGLTDEGELPLPLSQPMLADALGMTPVHINRVLKDLRLAGAMEAKRGSVSILDPDKLVQIAGFDENYLYRRLRRAEG